MTFYAGLSKMDRPILSLLQAPAFFDKEKRIFFQNSLVTADKAKFNLI
jgi:hypothetical protein